MLALHALRTHRRHVPALMQTTTSAATESMEPIEVFIPECTESKKAIEVFISEQVGIGSIGSIGTQ